MTGLINMETQFDINIILNRGFIKSEIELEQAFIADRKLRLFSKEDKKYKVLRDKLRTLISQYEADNWSESQITEARIKESDEAELIAEEERKFIQNRKAIILRKLKKLGLTQQDFGKILGHNSKSYISELMNGIRPFSLNDIVLIHHLLKINFKNLIPAFLSWDEKMKIESSLQKLSNQKFTLQRDNLELTKN